MSSGLFLSYALLVLLVGGGGGGHSAFALPMAPPISRDCGNGIFCAASQTCMSNITGAGLIYACSPLTNAVRCMDARFSCQAGYSCAENSRCIPNHLSVEEGSVAAEIDAVLNLDAFEVSQMRDFGKGLKPTSSSICGPITSLFRLPNFCTCKDARFGGELGCTVGLQTYISIGATAWVLPCASPANFGYRAWATLLGTSRSIGNTWSASFTLSRPIPGASFEIGRSNAGARVELSGEVNRFVLSTRVAIGVCATLGVGPFTLQMCNPSALPWLPVTILNGPRFDFSRFC
jgi:hypothetical protein